MVATTLTNASPDESPRQKAAIQWNDAKQRSSEHTIDFALEWQFDTSKASKEFVSKRFRILLKQDAACCIAIIQTQTHAGNGLSKAEKLVDQMRSSIIKKRERDNRPVGLIEIRRVHNDQQKVKFCIIGYDLGSREQMDLGSRDF